MLKPLLMVFLPLCAVSVGSLQTVEVQECLLHNGIECSFQGRTGRLALLVNAKRAGIQTGW
jgi:hypothetical protein